MKKFLLSAVITIACCPAFAQGGDSYKTPSKESQAYHEYRLEATDPPFSLQKIKAMLEKVTRKESDEGDGVEALDQKLYLALSLREKFTYNAINPETYSQVCDAMPPLQDEQKKIFGQLPDGYGEYNWSDHQKKFFVANKDSVMKFMKGCIITDNRIGLNFKHIIIDINAREMIPFLIETYNANKKDHDILTVLMLLMKNNEYDIFLTSLSYKKLYAPGLDGESSYKVYLDLNTANEALIIKRATDFYNGLAK